MRVSSPYSLPSLYVLAFIIVHEKKQADGFIIQKPSTLKKQVEVGFSSLSTMNTSSLSIRKRSPASSKESLHSSSQLERNHLSSTLLQSSSGQNNNLEAPSNTKDDDTGIVSVLGVVLPLLLVYISNQWSRSSIYYLVDFSPQSSSDSLSSFYAMNLDIGFDQAQYGVLASLGFTALFAITSLFAGNLADKYNRKYLTVGSAIVWAIATFTTSIASTYDEVFASRVIMGLACAFTTPCAYTLLKDVVNNAKLGLANSMYGSGVYFGGGLSSLSILLDDKFGWRNTCGAIAGYGVVAAMIAALTLPNDPKQIAPSTEVENTSEDSSQVVDDDKSSSTDNGMFNDAQQILISNKRLQWLFLGSFSRFCSGLCIGVWAAPYYKLAFPDDAASYAVINAIIVGICGVLSGLIGGYFSDKSIKLANGKDGENQDPFSSPLLSLDANGARLIVPIVGSLLAVPTWWLTSHATTFDSAMVWLAMEYLVAECWFGPVVAVLQSEVRKGQGGIAQGMFALTGAVGNLAPSLLGLIYSRQITGDATSSSGSELLSTLLGLGVCGGYLVSALCFSLCATTPTSSDYELVKNQ
jgi:MFS family permease